MTTASSPTAKNPVLVGALGLHYGLLSFGLMLFCFLAVNALKLEHFALARTILGPGLLTAGIALLGMVIGSLTVCVLMMNTGTDSQFVRANSPYA